MRHRNMDFRIAVLFLILGNRVNAFLDSNNACPNSNDFRCTSGECIPKSKQCDGHEDCLNGYDEYNCEQIMCRAPNYFKCEETGLCISSSFVCDGEYDCTDFSDEKNCTNFKIEVQTNCSDTEWMCQDRLCIPKEWVCNGESDCLDSSDETIGCTAHLECDGFKCKDGHCVPSEWRCDGHPDCMDKTDEQQCGINVEPHECTFDNRRYLCKDNKTCVDLSNVCDGHEHCPDKSDESPMCTDKNKTCADHNCFNECVQLPEGPFCLCPKGYHLVSEKHCEDIDECKQYGICDQKCRNKDGSYECYCDHKYILESDNRTCKASGGEALMLFSSKTSIRAYYLDSLIYYSVANRLKQVVGIAYDGHFIYWTDIYSGSESIVRSDEHGSNRELLVSAGLGAPEDLAVDWITGNIYFTDAELQHIGVCTNDGLKCTVIVNKDIHKPRGIVLNPASGEMFWSDWGRKPEIGRSKMDGTDDISFVSNDIKWPNGLAIDYPTQRLYWVDARLATIESILLDGTDRRIILSGIVKHPYAIAVFEDKLYWSDWSTHSIQSCDKYTGKNHHTLVKEKKEYIYGVHVFHSSLKQRTSNPCSGSFCSDICLLSGNSYSCACPQDKILSSNNHSCIETEKKKLLIIGAGDMLLVLQHQKLGKHHITALPVSFKQISAIAYNNINGAIFIADNVDKKIFSLGLEDKESKTLISNGLGEVSSLDFDYYGNNLYWCDMELGTVEVMSLNTMTRKVILRDLEGEIPLDIALVPEEGIMFIAFQKAEHSVHIDRLHMDGQGGRTHVIEQGLIGPLINMIYDSGLQRIFFSDSHTGNIESTSIDGDDRHAFRTLLTEPVSLAVLGNDIFWTNLKSRKVYWADKLNSEYTYTKKITLDISQNIDSMRLVPATGKIVINNPCLENNGGCSHLCLRSLNDYVCACPLGQSLQNDNKTCYTPKHCNSVEFHCEKSDICIPKKLRCNGVKDCEMGEDEIDCAIDHHCPTGYFQCQNGECILNRKVCDFHYDCKDISDELNCHDHEIKEKCAFGFFECGDGNCIADRFVCDGIQDCSDGKDEIKCTSLTCSVNEFRCGSGMCIPKSWECDHEFDCADQTDEHANCAPPTCAPDQFTCNNGRCLDTSLRCNFVDDCGDHSDELGCNEHTLLATHCEDYQFQCNKNSTVCVHEDARCNGSVECPNGEDELNCSRCHSDEFECANKKCIISSWVCDNADDCGDKSDETEELCKNRKENATYEFTSEAMDRQRIQVPCENGFRCKTGHCIDMKLVCNGHENCYDGSDEHGSCDSSCEKNNNPCSGTCLKTPSGPKCSCPEGYELRGDSITCQDINECQSEPKICSHLCTNTEGSFTCACYEGYLLRPDRRSCKAVGDAMSILFSSASEIRQLNPSQNSLQLLFSEDLPRITGLDISLASNYVYFSTELMSSVHRISLKDKTRESVFGVGQPQKLSVDWVTENVYFVNAKSMTREIQACHLHEQKCAKILEVATHDQISSLVIDGYNKYMFYSTTSWWLFNSPTSVIYKANLDGSKVHELLKKDLGYITGLTYDYNKKLLYFSDQHLHQIQSIDYDGNNRQTVLKNSYTQHPIGLNLFEDYIYFLTPNGQMTKCKIYGELQNCNTFKLHAFNTEMFVISQKSKQPNVSNACDKHNCTHLCVQSEIGAHCVCSDGSKVKDSEVCETKERSAVDDMMITKPVFTIHAVEEKSNSYKVNSALVGLFVCLIIVGLAVGVYFYIHKKLKRTGKLNINVSFHNPIYGNGTTRTEENIKPGQHEYSNPVHINTQDMQAAANNILQRSKQFTKCETLNENDNKLIAF